MVVAVVALAAVAAAVVVAMEDQNGIQWWQWCEGLMAAVVLVVTFNGSSVGKQQSGWEMQTQQTNNCEDSNGGQHWVSEFYDDKGGWHLEVSAINSKHKEQQNNIGRWGQWW